MKGMRNKVLPILTILTVLIIWGHSLLPGDVSSEESGRVLELLLPIWNGLGLGKLLPLDEHIVRKAFGHFLEYAVLGLELGGLAVLSFREMSGESNAGDRILSAGKSVVQLAFTGFLVAFIDESIQMISPDRGPAIADVWLDFGGVVSGMTVVLVLRRIHIIR